MGAMTALEILIAAGAVAFATWVLLSLEQHRQHEKHRRMLDRIWRDVGRRQ